MNEITTSSPFNREWFSLTGPFATVKEEYKDKFNAALKEKRKQDAEYRNSLNEKMRDRDTKVVLTEEQKSQLSAKYDPQNMTKDEFDAFIDDLCSYGVLQKEDKEIILPGRFIPLWQGPEVWVTTQTNCWMDFSYSSCNGNALAWTKHLSSYESYNPIKQNLEKDARSILCGIVASALEQIKI